MAIQDYCIGLKGAVNAIHRVTRALSGNVNSTTISDAVEEVAIAIENGGGGGGGGTTDHTKLQNRDSADQHPISAITGLETELNEKANTSSTYTKSEVDTSLATKQEKLQSGTNIKTINNQSLLGNGNVDVSDIFVAEIRVTPYEDVLDAIYAGKHIFLSGSGFMLVPSAVKAMPGYIILRIVQNSGATNTPSMVFTEYRVTQGVMEDAGWTVSPIANMQLLLESGINIKTINNISLLGRGNINTPKGVDFEVGVEKWYGTYKDGNTTYPVYSKVIYISALPSTSGITNYPHGVTDIKQVLSMYGICTNGMVMNTPRQTTSDNIGIYQVQKSGNFAIEVGKDRSSIGAYVTMIYAKNN